MSAKATVGNGSIQLPLNTRQYFVLTGGRSQAPREGFRFVKMAEEIDLPCDIDIPTVDFGVTDVKLMMQRLPKVIDLILAGEPVYVGCMGGQGRTGFVLALVAKAFGVKQPTKFIRANYMAHAVETEKQEAYVKNFKIPPQVYIKIKKAREASLPATVVWEFKRGPFHVSISFRKFWQRLSPVANLTRLPPLKVQPGADNTKLGRTVDKLVGAK